MSAMLTSADKAWMDANFASIVDDVGVLCSIKRITRDPDTKLTTSPTTILSNEPIFIDGFAPGTVEVLDAAAGSLARGIMKKRSVPTQVQKGDLVVAPDRTYEIVGVEIFPLTIGLLLLYKTQDTEATPIP